MTNIEKLYDFEHAIALVPQIGEAIGSKNSYFGGLPKLPEYIEWPRDFNGRAMNFVAQIDFSECPQLLEYQGTKLPIKGIPQQGILFVFLSLGDDEISTFPENAHKVIYIKDSLSCEGFRKAPSDLPKIWGGYNHFGNQMPNLLARVPILPKAYVSTETTNPLMNSLLQQNPIHAAQVQKQERQNELNSLQLDKIAPRKNEVGLYLTNIRAPWMENCGGYKLARLKKPLILPNNFPWIWGIANLVVASLDRMIDCQNDKASAWKEAANNNSFSQPMSAIDIQIFQAWMTEVDNEIGSLNDPMQKHRMMLQFTLELQLIFRHAWPYVLELRDVLKVPEDFVGAIAPLFAPRNTGIDIHKLLGSPHNIQPGNQKADKECLLFQIESDRGLGLIFVDNGNFQIFINKEDLERLDFSNTRLSGNSH